MCVFLKKEESFRYNLIIQGVRADSGKYVQILEPSIYMDTDTLTNRRSSCPIPPVSNLENGGMKMQSRASFLFQGVLV